MLLECIYRNRSTNIGNCEAIALADSIKPLHCLTKLILNLSYAIFLFSCKKKWEFYWWIWCKSYWKKHWMFAQPYFFGNFIQVFHSLFMWILNRNNKIKEKGAKYIAQGIENLPLTQLELNFWYFTKMGFSKFYRGNYIGENGAIAIADCLNCSSLLTHLELNFMSLSYFSISNSIGEILFETMEQELLPKKSKVWSVSKNFA